MQQECHDEMDYASFVHTPCLGCFCRIYIWHWIRRTSIELQEWPEQQGATTDHRNDLRLKLCKALPKLWTKSASSTLPVQERKQGQTNRDKESMEAQTIVSAYSRNSMPDRDDGKDEDHDLMAWMVSRDVNRTHKEAMAFETPSRGFWNPGIRYRMH